MSTTTEDPNAPESAKQDLTAPSEASAPEAALSPEELDALKAKAELAAQHWDRLLRVSADFDNYKKRAARERQDAVKYATEDLLQKLIPVLDNFDAAVAAAATAGPAGLQSLKDGVTMIHQQLRSALTDGGLLEVDASGKPFDPNLHEAVSEADSLEVPEGHVLRQLRKGYKLRERLLRPATVIVARKPAS